MPTAGGAVGNCGVASGALSTGGANDAGVGPGTKLVDANGPGLSNPFSDSLRDGAFKGDGQNLGGQKGSAGLGGGGTGGGNGGSGLGASTGGGGGDNGEKFKINSGVYGGGPGTGYFGKTSGSGGVGSRSNGGGVNYNKLSGSQFDPRRDRDIPLR